MASVGEYVADSTEGISKVEDLPKPIVIRRRRNHRHGCCPHCGRRVCRLRSCRRHLHDLGDLYAGRPRDLQVRYSQHYCPACHCYFSAAMGDLAAPHSQYTHRVVQLAVRLVVEDGLPYRWASWHLWRDHRVFVPFATLQNWVEAGGKKGRGPARRGVSGRGPGALQRLSGRR
jgi:hypothetical protein